MEYYILKYYEKKLTGDNQIKGKRTIVRILNSL